MKNQEWKQFWNSGESYLHLAEKGAQRPEKFNAVSLYNIASMAIEGLFMGYFVSDDCLPPNHTLRDFVEFEKERAGFPDALGSRLLEMEKFQQICSLDTYKPVTMTPEDVAEFVSVAKAVHTYLIGLIPDRDAKICAG